MRDIAEKVFIRLYLMSLMGMLAGLFNEGQNGSPQLFEISWAFLYLASAALILPRALGGITGRGWFMLAFGVWILSSASWSELPRQSLKYGTGMSMNIAFAVWLGFRFSVGEIAEHLRKAVNTLLGLSAFAIALGLQNAFYDDALARTNIIGLPMLQGLFPHKNYLGVYAAAGVVLNLALGQGWRGVAAIGLCFAGVVLSGSMTGVLALLAGVSVWAANRFTQTTRARLTLFPLALAFVAAAAAFATNIGDQEISQLLGRDTSLTGRTDLWRWAIIFFQERPIFGWGYGGIFAASGAGPSDIFFSGYYRAPHFHSGYLQILAEMGIAGGLVLGIVVITVFRDLTVLAQADSDGAVIGLICVFAALFAVMPAINLLLRYNDLTTVALISIYVSAGLARRAKASWQPEIPAMAGAAVQLR